MKQLKKTLLTLVALFAISTGAWADDAVLLTTINASADFQSGSKTFDNIATVTLTGNFYGSSTWDGNGTITVEPANASVNITKVKFINTSSTIEDTKAPYEAVQAYNSNLSHIQFDVDGNKGNYAVDKIEVYGTAAPAGTALTPDATRKVWTLDAMPAGNVELQVAYFPGMLTLPAKTAQGSIEVVGLSLGGPKAFDVPAAWSSDETMLSANDLPADFAAIDDADLPATISALSSDAGALLIYGFAGEKTKVVSYVNGTKDDTDAGFIKRYDVTGWIEGGFKIYYTTATTLPAGFDTDGTNYYVEPKTQFQVKAVPAEGYHLVSLSDGTNTYDVDANGIATVTMPEGDADLTLTATFSDEFELTFDDVNFKTNQNITVKVGEADKTLDQDGKLSVKSGQTVTLTAKQGYKFRSVEAKKAGPAVKTFNCAGVELIYEDGDTWAKVIERNPGKIYDDSGWIGRSDTNFFLIEGEVLNNGNQIITTDKIVDPTATYSWQAG